MTEVPLMSAMVASGSLIEKGDRIAVTGPRDREKQKQPREWHLSPEFFFTQWILVHSYRLHGRSTNHTRQHRRDPRLEVAIREKLRQAASEQWLEETRFPYLLDIQVDLLSDLPTRLVVPLRRGTGPEPWVVFRLHPMLELGDTSVVAVFSELAVMA
jgi:hypothetical protein